MLDGGRPSDVVALEAKNRANERMISHLNIQVDYLQQKNRDSERKMREFNLLAEDSHIKAHSLKTKTRELEHELSDRERMALKYKTEKDVVVRAADREMNEAKVNSSFCLMSIRDVRFGLKLGQICTKLDKSGTF